MKIKVILTDGNLTNTLAAVRCLGKYKNIEVYVTSESEKCLSSFSKFCKGNFKLPSPLDDNVFIKELINLIRKEKFDILIPIGYYSEKAIIKNKKKIEKLILLPLVDYKKFEIADRKDKSIKFSKKISINVPNTLKVKKTNDLKKIKNYPVVIKPIEGWGGVKYAKNYEDLLKKYKEIKNSVKKIPIIQEYIPGNNGYGFYTLYNKGKLVTYYIHKRLHMYPKSGGPATMARTYYHKEIYKQGKKILDTIKWHGVAMVEFKQHEENRKFYLIEINPKYWGSLDLGIAAGLDIPYYHIMIGLGKKIKVKKKYKKNVVFRWPARDLLYALSGKYKLLEIIKWILLFFDYKVKDNIWISDLKPTLFQIKEGVKRFKERFKEFKEDDE